MDSKNKTILVTAAAKRLGKFIATDLVKCGWKVAIHYYKSKISAEETADYLSQIGGSVSIHQADLSCKNDIKKLVKEIESQDATWAGLINNAGCFNYDDGITFKAENLQTDSGYNVDFPPEIIQEAEELMQEFPES